MKTNITSFGTKALELDEYFSEIERLSSQINDASLDSDSDFQLAVKLLSRFTEKAMGLEQAVAQFAKTMEEMRESSGASIQAVAEKAQLIQKRKNETDALQEKLNALGIRVRDVVSGLAHVKNLGEMDAEEKARLPEELKVIEAQIGGFIDEAQSIKEQAQKEKFKETSSSAESLQATLQNAKATLSSTISHLH
ncbi:MAG: hypothetical protein AB7F59_01025 [Bdellovibrionales bacterium]